MTYVDFGTPHPTAAPEVLGSDRARALYSAVCSSRDFDLAELRSWASGGVTYDVLVVDCMNDQVPSRNRFGIKNRERMALVVPPSEAYAPQARALRKDFPSLPHVNQSPEGEPAHLCLYLEPWSETRRSWTPQLFLKRILWWLARSSTGTIHGDFQPVERLYFDFDRQLVFGRGFEEALARKPCHLIVTDYEKEAGLHVTRANFGRLNARATCMATIVIRSDQVVHGRVEEHPTRLGQLHAQLAAHGLSLFHELRIALAMRAACNRRLVSPDLSLIVIDTIIRRDRYAKPEKQETRAFFVESLVELGRKLGILVDGAGGISHTDLLTHPSSAAWEDIGIVPADVRSIPSRSSARRMSGIPDAMSEERRTLIGVGALGSSLLELWTRGAWGRWTLVDPDRIEPHNVVRHIARTYQIGKPKVVAARNLMSLVYDDDYEGTDVIWANAVPKEPNEKLSAALATSTLIVDVSTTLTVPRELSVSDTAARCASAFVTPSGRDAVLMFESSDRALRLHDIEPQYYASLLADDWGNIHLGTADKEIDRVRVGNGCRDASVVMSLERIQLFAAVIAPQVRARAAETSASLSMWRAEDDGAVSSRTVPVVSASYISSSHWTIVSNANVEAKMRRLREQKLPVETGGVIVGYTDHQSSMMFVVDVLPAPTDSVESATGFIRGKEGVKEQLLEVRRRTMNIVRYLGEWHSHPRRVSSKPSGDDLYLSVHLAAELAADGVPALMIIVGDPTSRYILSDCLVR